MTSLRARIAISFATLLVCVLVAMAVALSFAFSSILYDQAKSRGLATADAVARVSSSGLSVLDEPIELVLASQYNLDHWSGPKTFVQIDSPQGDMLGRSSNMGGMRFPAVTLKNGEQRIGTQQTEQGNVLVIDRPIIDSGHVVAVEHIGEQLDLIEVARNQAELILAIVTVLACAAVIGASSFIARSAIDPINRLTVAMDEIGSNELNRRLGWSGRRDEVGRLAATFDAMLARIADAFARERQFISDASHELKTPLTVINANAQMLMRWADRDPEIRAESLSAIVTESSALAGMVNGMLTLAKADAGESVPKEPVPVDALVEDCVRHLDERARSKGLELRFVRKNPEVSALVMADEKLLRQLVNNLIENAIKFTETGGVEASAAVAVQESEAAVEVADTGPGISAEAAEHIFERFYRADASHSRAIEGTGLGLAIVRSIAQLHGGRVEVRPRPGGGSIFMVRLPLLEVVPTSQESVIESS